jgi:ABC-type Fe3+-hydroxamate transport system substrate-binding protein
MKKRSSAAVFSFGTSMFLRCAASLALILVAACRASSPTNQETAATKTNRPGPERIISLSPSVTEIVTGLGAFQRVVAVCQFCDFPPEVKRLPRLGGWQNPKLEQVMELRPNLVIMTEAQAPFVQKQLQMLGIQTLAVPSLSIEHTFAAIKAIGDAIGCADQAESLTTQTKVTLDEIGSRTKQLPRPRVLCVVGRVPGTLHDLYVATKGSFLEQLIGIAGGDPLSPTNQTGYGKMSKEAVMTLDPEVIIDMVPGAESKLTEDPLQVWRQLPEIKAMQKGRIFPIKETSVLHPSQFIADTCRRFAKIIHPEIF